MAPMRGWRKLLWGAAVLLAVAAGTLLLLAREGPTGSSTAPPRAAPRPVPEEHGGAAAPHPPAAHSSQAAIAQCLARTLLPEPGSSVWAPSAPAPSQEQYRFLLEGEVVGVRHRTGLTFELTVGAQARAPALFTVLRAAAAESIHSWEHNQVWVHHVDRILGLGLTMPTVVRAVEAYHLLSAVRKGTEVAQALAASRRSDGLGATVVAGVLALTPPHSLDISRKAPNADSAGAGGRAAEPVMQRGMKGEVVNSVYRLRQAAAVVQRRAAGGDGGGDGDAAAGEARAEHRAFFQLLHLLLLDFLVGTGDRAHHMAVACENRTALSSFEAMATGTGTRTPAAASLLGALRDEPGCHLAALRHDAFPRWSTTPLWQPCRRGGPLGLRHSEVQLSDSNFDTRFYYHPGVRKGFLMHSSCALWTMHPAWFPARLAAVPNTTVASLACYPQVRSLLRRRERRPGGPTCDYRLNLLESTVASIRSVLAACSAQAAVS